MDIDVLFYDLMVKLRQVTEAYTFKEYNAGGGALSEEEFKNKKIEFLEKQVTLFNLHKEVDQLAASLLLS